ncbi:MAG TPA: hypothetical protein VFB50_03500 [Chloroflexota bacterium]|nr:hypothetical protein [Chloroflexota bacterium]
MTHKEQASVRTADLLEVNTLSVRAQPMSTITLPASDPRGAKAVEIATDSGQWAKCTTRDGRKYYGIRSSDGSHYYLVTRNSCTCYDAQRHTCKHMLAVRLHCELVKEQQDAAKYDDIFKRFDYDEDRALTRILGVRKPQRGVIPASQIERED